MIRLRARRASKMGGGLRVTRGTVAEAARGGGGKSVFAEPLPSGSAIGWHW
jgi:hypothetical protein